MTWRDPESGARRLDRGTEWFRFRDGKICEVRAYHHSGPRTAPATWSASTTRLAATRRCSRAPRSALHGGARGVPGARAGVRRHRAAPRTWASGSAPVVPQRGVPALRARGLPRAEVRGALRRHRAAATSPTPCGPRSSRACGSGGLAAGIGAHTSIATPPIWKFGTEDQKQRYLVPAIRGEKIGALGITEPDAGSDVAGIKTRAERVDGGFVVNGSKTFITNGVRADFIVTAVKTTVRRRPPRALLPGRRPRRGRDLEQAGEARLARLGHGDDRLRGRVRARGEPAGRGEPGLLPDHGQLPVGAAADGARRGRRHGPPGRAAGRAAGREATPSQAQRHRSGRDRGGARGRPLAHLPRAAALRGRPRRRARGDDGQARHPARDLRDGRRRPRPARRRAARWPAPPAMRASAPSAAAPTRS